MAAQQKLLTKADTVALWHAVDYALMVREMRGMDFSEEQLQAEKVLAAKQALRKVNAIRRRR